MGLNFKKSIKIMPGVKINIGKTGVSTSIGPRGAKINIGKRGTRATVGVPGTGISFTQKISSNSKKQKSLQPETLQPSDAAVHEDKANDFIQRMEKLNATLEASQKAAEIKLQEQKEKQARLKAEADASLAEAKASFENLGKVVKGQKKNVLYMLLLVVVSVLAFLVVGLLTTPFVGVVAAGVVFGIGLKKYMINNHL